MNNNSFFRNIIIVSAIVAISIIAVVLTGCQEEDNTIHDMVPIGLKKYFDSQDYADLKKNFAFDLSDFSFDNIIEENPIPEVTIYYVSIQKKNRFGTLAVFLKDNNNDKVYKSLFSDMSETKRQDQGVIPIYTAKNFFVAEYKFEKTGFDNTTLKMQIDRVGNAKIGAPRLKSGIEWPSPDDGWWYCTTTCYSISKGSCDDDAPCQLLCDLLNITGLCTLSIVAACAIYCI